MVLMYEPMALAVKAAKRKAPADTKVGLVSPQGEIFEQRMAIDKSQLDGIIVVWADTKDLTRGLSRSLLTSNGQLATT